MPHENRRRVGWRGRLMEGVRSVTIQRNRRTFSADDAARNLSADLCSASGVVIPLTRTRVSAAAVASLWGNPGV
jgi:hypothetical protein